MRNARIAGFRDMIAWLIVAVYVFWTLCKV